MAEFVVKDSGARYEFSSGMVRDTADDKTQYIRVYDGPMLDRWADHLTKGAKKYPDTKPGTPNWMLAAGAEELERFKSSAARHFRQWLRGDQDEDHAAAVFFNVNGYEYVKAQIDAERRTVDCTLDAPCDICRSPVSAGCCCAACVAD